MRKITKFPKTRKEFHRCHVKMWDWIYNHLQVCDLSMYYMYINGLKNKAIESCFGGKLFQAIAGLCFACHWSYNGNPAQFTLAINDPYIIQLGVEALCLNCATKLRDKLIKIINTVLKSNNKKGV